jgi:hypothetical protein
MPPSPCFRNIASILVFGIIVFGLGESAGWSQVNPPGSKGPNSGNLIRPEYYTAIDFKADGQTAQATSLLEASLAKCRVINDQRGIDSVPGLVMSGECFREQCDIAMSLERYDEALQISMMGSRWITLLKSPNGTIRADTKPRDIHWATNSRGAQMGIFPESWPIVLGSSDVLLEMPAGQGVTGKTLSIDALEILRCQAIALRRRHQLLGPLVKHNPLTAPLADAFRINLNGQHDAIVCGFNVCRAMAELGVGNHAEAAKLLKQNLSLASGMDHPLTAVALLALADLAIEANDLVDAEERSIEASIVAAKAGQMDHLAEAVEYLASTGFAAGHDAAVAKTLPQIITWSGTKGRSVAIRGQVEWAKLLAILGNIPGCKERSVAATTMLLPTQIVMPRAEAVIRYARARCEFQEGKTVEGVNSLMESAAFLRGAGSAQGVPIAFQLNLTQQLTQGSMLGDAVAEEVLTALLKSPREGYWRTHPLEHLVWLSTDKSEAMNLLLGIHLRTKSDAELVDGFDEAIRMRYRQSSALESRAFDLQLAIHGDNRFVSGSDAKQLGLLRKQMPGLDLNANKIADSIAPLLANPKWDMRKWSEDESRRWESALRLSESQQSLLWAASVSPYTIPEIYPPRHSQEALTKVIQTNDAVVFFGFHSGQLRGFLFQSGKWRSWNVVDADKHARVFLDELMSLKSRDGSASELKKSWPLKNRVALRNSLFPKDVWTLMRQSERWIIVPDRYLWYVPFELLPSTDQAATLPIISERKIVLSPTLGLVPYLVSPNKPSRLALIDVHMPDFFSRDAARSKEIRDELGAGKHIVVDTSVKNHTFPNSRFFKLASRRISAYFPIQRDSVSMVPIDGTPNQPGLQSWGRLPWGTPESIVAIGVNAMPASPNTTGDEWLRLMLPCIAQGTRQMTISRWSVGGESSASLMRSYVDNQQDMSCAEAWQRSVVSLWEEQFDPKREPLFRDGPAGRTEGTISGGHPLLWAGYMNIGD